MKNLLIVATLILSTTTFAKGPKGDGQGDGQKTFADHKSKVLERIDARMANIEEHKKCVSAAQDKKALKACREANQERMKNLRGDRMGRGDGPMGMGRGKGKGKGPKKDK